MDTRASGMALIVRLTWNPDPHLVQVSVKWRLQNEA